MSRSQESLRSARRHPAEGIIDPLESLPGGIDYPDEVEATEHPQPALRTPPRPFERGADVLHLLPQRAVLGHRAAVPARLVRLVSKAAVAGAMTVARRCIVALRYKLLSGVLADRLEQAVTHALVATLDLDHRLLHQPGQRIQHIAVSQGWEGADLFNRSGVNGAGEDRHTVQEALLVEVQESIAPVDGGAERVLPRDGAAAAAVEEPQAVLETRDNVVRRQRRHARSRQLDRKGHAIEPPADRQHRAGVGGVHHEAWPH